jgi:PST family polysaccharide transporter/lipopolysaccharide exporter
LVAVLLGASWSEAVPVVQVLAAWGVLRALGSLTTALFRAVGRPDIPARHHWRMVIVTAAVLIPSIEIAGLVGAAVAVLVPNLLIHWRRYRDVASVLGIDVDRIVRRLIAPMSAGAVMTATMAVATVATASLWPGWTLVVSGIAGSCAYLLVVALLERSGHCRAFHSLRALTRGGTA